MSKSIYINDMRRDIDEGGGGGGVERDWTLIGEGIGDLSFDFDKSAYKEIKLVVNMQGMTGEVVSAFKYDLADYVPVSELPFYYNCITAYEGNYGVNKGIKITDTTAEIKQLWSNGTWSTKVKLYAR